MSRGLSALTCLLFLGVVQSASYQAPDECDWAIIDGKELHEDSQVSLECKLRTINSELDKTNFSLIQAHQTVRLRIECGDALFYQSFLNAGAFTRLTELRDLSIEYCKIGNLSGGSFHGLLELRNLTLNTHNDEWSPLTLQLSSSTFNELNMLERLDLAENNIWSLPEGLFCPLKSLGVLNLTKNRLQDLSNLKLSAKATERCNGNLNVLDASFNAIQVLQADTLSGLTRLHKLYLNDNALTFIAERALDGLTSLHVLRLSNNKLSNLPPEIFADVTQLRELYIDNNTISVIAPGVFGSVTNLQVVDMSRNELTNTWINSATFRGLSNLVVLDMSFNRLTKLEPAIFRDLFNLQILRFSDNFIESIGDATFTSLFNLHTLTMSNNRLTSIDANALIGLSSLSVLSIDNNLLSHLDSESLKNCTNLHDLHLNGNKLQVVPRILHNVPILHTLDLGENHIAHIDPDTFAHVQLMFGLRLSDNQIGNITKDVFSQLPALKILNLSRNRIEYIEPGAFDATTNLQAMRLDGNQLRDVGGLFTKLPKLVWLNISDNQLEWFDYALIPLGLEWLDIHLNRLTELGNYFELESQIQLKTFDASFNLLTEISGASIPNGVQAVCLNDNLIGKIHSYTFFKKPNLTRVDLFNNRLKNLDPNALRISPVLEGGDEIPPDFYIAGNPFECDCTMEWLQQINHVTGGARNQPRVSDLEHVFCKLSYTNMNEIIQLVDMSADQFLCKYDSHCYGTCHCCDFQACDCKMTCPMNCTCYHDRTWTFANVITCSESGYVNKIPDVPVDATQLYLDGNDLRIIPKHAFIGRKKMRILFLNSSNINEIYTHAFSGLTELNILHLNDNHLRTISGFEFDDTLKLKELYLQNNLIEFVNMSAFAQLQALNVVQLDRNRLKMIAVWLLPPMTAHVTLAGNPFSCECTFLDQIRPYLLHESNVIDAHLLHCVFESTNNSDLDDGFSILDEKMSLTSCTTNTTTIHSPQENQTKRTIIQRTTPNSSDTSLYLLIFVTCALFASLILLTFFFRQETRVWLHSRFGVRLFARKSDDLDVETDKLYDAFVSYSSKDEMFVVQQLAPILEQGDPPYKLCLHYRDFPVGGYIADTIVHAVENSKRTIMILSENFIKSEWCRFEFKSAHHQVLRDRRKRLIVILLGAVPQKDLDPDIRLYLKMNTYLQWGDKLFWQKLKFALPDVPNNRRVHRRASASGSAIMRNNVIRNSINYNLHHHVHRYSVESSDSRPSANCTALLPNQNVNPAGVSAGAESPHAQRPPVMHI